MRRWVKWVVGIVIALIVVFVGGPFVYIHFIEGPAPKPLSLPSTSQRHPSITTGFPTGIWKATSSSVVGYRVNEVLFGQNNVAVGRTHSVTGSITLSGTSVSAGTFTVEMATVHSNESQRDAQFDGRIMSVSEFPTATFTLVSPIVLSAQAAAGATVKTTASGNLTLRGQTNVVTFPLSARYTGSAIDITGSIPILFSQWGIDNPGFGGQITVDNHGLLEFLLVLHPGAAS